MTPNPPTEDEPEVEASIVSARSTGESMPVAAVRLRFENPAATAAVVSAYRITWPGGRFEARPRALRVEAGGEVERTARIDMRHGDIAALLARSAEAKLEVTRVGTP